MLLLKIYLVNKKKKKFAGQFKIKKLLILKALLVEIINYFDYK